MDCARIEWPGSFDEVIMIEQDTPPQPQSSIPATFLGVFDAIRTLFASSAQAKERGYQAGHFSFLARDGQCPECGGAGSIPVSLDYWADARVGCHSCHGRRYQPDVLEIRIGGLSIADVLDQPFNAMSRFVVDHFAPQDGTAVLRALELAGKTGLGYLPMGQPLSTLSTGEMQRLKLAAGLALAAAPQCLFLLDEPTGGLHPRDIAGLLRLFDELIAAGGTVLCITHEPLITHGADWLIELGPGAGRNGGKVVFAGRPPDRD